MSEVYNLDEIFARIFKDQDESLGKFFDAIFGYFYRQSPEALYDSSMHYGRQVLISQYEKWQKQYLDGKKKENKSKSKDNLIKSGEVENKSKSEEVNSWEKSLKQGGGPTRTTNTATVSNSRKREDNTFITESKKEKNAIEKSFFDVTNGAQFDLYAWAQTAEDIEVRIPVHESVRKGSQVQVHIGKKSLKVHAKPPSGSSSIMTDAVDIIDGELNMMVKSDESAWFLSPGQHLSILLEKCESRWWDRLLSSENAIDLNKIDLERPMSSLPQEERMQIEKTMIDHRREREGKLTSEQQKMASILEKAWNAEDSPFKGQPFDPSIVKSMTNCPSDLNHEA